MVPHNNTPVFLTIYFVSLMFFVYFSFFWDEFMTVVGVNRVEEAERRQRVAKAVWEFMVDNADAARLDGKLDRKILITMTVDHFNFVWEDNPEVIDWLYYLAGYIQ